MYSERLLKFLSEKGISEGDRIKVKRGSLDFEGILMPKIGFGDPECLVIKLESGYNAGIEIGADSEVLLVSKKLEREKEEAVSPVGNALQIKKEKVVLLATGGTIASKVEYETGAVKPSISGEELASLFPEISRIADLDARQVFNVSSEDMTPAHWSKLAEEVHESIRKGCEGVVITHGTDTMGYTSAALSFMLPDLSVPVVLTGSQRSSDRGSSDNKMNLVCSVLCAKTDIAHVGICMHATSNDDFCYFHPGTRVRKMHTSRRDAFQTIGGEPLALVDYSKLEAKALGENYRKKDKGRETKLESRINPNVALIYTHPGIKPELISSLSKYEGVVIAGTGLGHISVNIDSDSLAKPIFAEVKALCDSGIPVVMAPQTIWGRIGMDVYADGRKLIEAGVIGNGCDMIPETALVKLMWVLGHEKNQKKVKEEMEKNFAGEITERSNLL